MNVKPIPNELLGEQIVLIVPTATGTAEYLVENVRAERSEKIEDSSAKSPRCYDEITVWADFHNSKLTGIPNFTELIETNPEALFPVGALVRYKNELFEVFESKIYKAGTPHHIKFKARKTGDDNL